MSARFYPRWVKGNPQLRIFLPDWKMVLIKPKEPLPNNIVTFKTDVKMTDWDIKNYLEKIYQVSVAGIRSRILSGDLKRSTKGLTKQDDYRIARVILTPGKTFEWPELFPKEKEIEERQDYERTLDEISKTRKIDKNSTGIPGWFT